MFDKNAFHTKWLGKEFYHKDITDSTSLDIKKLADGGSTEGTVVCADMQTAGRGRRGRNWQSNAGDNLLFSILLRPQMQPEKAPQITLLMALAVTKVLRECHGFDAKIKWPNDVVVNGKKVCGILTEMYMDGGRIDSVIVGTGINVNQKEIPEELTESATALCLQKGMDFNREEILNDILIVFEEYYEEFLQKNTLQQFSNRYNEWLVSLNTEVRVLDPQGEYSGIAKGINESGELLVEVSDGKIEAVYAGEVSVRGLYGYV